MTESKLSALTMARTVIVPEGSDPDLLLGLVVGCANTVGWSLVDDLLMPDAFTVEVLDKVSTTLTFECREGVFRCVDLHLARPHALGGVTTEALRLDLGLVLEVAVRAIAMGAHVGGDSYGVATIDFDPYATAEGRHLSRGLLPRRGRPSLTDEHYVAVARDYRRAYEEAEGDSSDRNRAALDVVADAFGRSVRTAQRWVKVARSRGLVPEEYGPELVSGAASDLR